MRTPSDSALAEVGILATDDVGGRWCRALERWVFVSDRIDTKACGKNDIPNVAIVR